MKQKINFRVFLLFVSIFMCMMDATGQIDNQRIDVGLGEYEVSAKELRRIIKNKIFYYNMLKRNGIISETIMYREEDVLLKRVNIEKDTIDLLQTRISIDTNFFLLITDFRFVGMDSNIEFNKIVECNADLKSILCFNGRIYSLDSLYASDPAYAGVVYENIRIVGVHKVKMNEEIFIVLYLSNILQNNSNVVVQPIIFRYTKNKSILHSSFSQYTNSILPFGDFNNNGRIDYISWEPERENINLYLYELKQDTFIKLHEYYAVLNWVDGIAYKIIYESKAWRTLLKMKKDQ